MSDLLTPLISAAPPLVVAIPLLGAFLVHFFSLLHDKLRNVFVLVMLGLSCFFTYLLTWDVFSNGIRTYVFGNPNPSTAVIRIMFEVDAFSAFMATITVTIAFVVALYSWKFMEEETGLSKYYTLLLLVTTGMLGMELTGDLFNFFVFLEITSIAAAALVAYRVGKAEAVEAGFKYIMVSAIGALFVLFAIALLYGQYNALNMGVIGQALQYTFLDKIALVVLIGALAMKAGLVPMHMWLPDSYGSASATVSVVLVTATLASFYGVLRIVFTVFGDVMFTQSATAGFSPNAMYGGLLIALSLLTIFVGVIMALIQTNIKRLIAFTALAEVGYLFLAIGTGLITMDTTVGQLAMTGGVFHIFNDVLDVGLLFLVTGAIYFMTKEESLDRLGGLARNSKVLTILFIIGLWAISGMPPLNGFASKLLIYQTTYQVNPILAIIAILGSIMILAVFVKVFYAVFMGPTLSTLKNIKKVPTSMLVAMGILAGIIIIFGLFPNIIIESLVQPATQALLNNAPYLAAIGGI
jgi:multicomponent Na+:H+ antiporter subunit D